MHLHCATVLNVHPFETPRQGFQPLVHFAKTHALKRIHGSTHTIVRVSVLTKVAAEADGNLSL